MWFDILESMVAAGEAWWMELEAKTDEEHMGG